MICPGDLVMSSDQTYLRSIHYHMLYYHEIGLVVCVKNDLIYVMNPRNQIGYIGQYWLRKLD